MSETTNVVNFPAALIALAEAKSPDDVGDVFKMHKVEAASILEWHSALVKKLDELQAGYDESEERFAQNWPMIDLAIRAGLPIMPQSHKARVYIDKFGVLHFKEQGTPTVMVGEFNAGAFTTVEQAWAHWLKNRQDEPSLCFTGTPLLGIDADAPRQKKGKNRPSGVIGLYSLVPADALKLYPQSRTQNFGRHVIGRMETGAAWMSKTGKLPLGIDVKAQTGFLRCGKRAQPGKEYVAVDGYADLWGAIRIEGERRAGRITGEPWSHVPPWPPAVMSAIDPRGDRFKPLAEQKSSVVERALSGYSEDYKPIGLESVLAGPFAAAIHAQYGDGKREFLGKDTTASASFFHWFGGALNVIGLTLGIPPEDLDDDHFNNALDWAYELPKHPDGIAEYAGREDTRQAYRCGMKNRERLMRHGYHTPKGCRKADFLAATSGKPLPGAQDATMEAWKAAWATCEASDAMIELADAERLFRLAVAAGAVPDVQKVAEWTDAPVGDVEAAYGRVQAETPTIAAPVPVLPSVEEALTAYRAAKVFDPGASVLDVLKAIAALPMAADRDVKMKALSSESSIGMAALRKDTKAMLGAVKAELSGIAYPHVSETGSPLSHSLSNICAWLEHRQKNIWFNEFAVFPYLDNEPMTDGALLQIMHEMHDDGFFVHSKNLKDGIASYAMTRACHPVRDILGGFVWDGVPRINTWLSDYCGAPRNAAWAHVSYLLMLALVMRIHYPGCKFDHILVLWGEEGLNKSELCRVLAINDDWLLEGFQLSWDQKTIIEMTEGKWVAEYAELAGHGSRDQGSIKDAVSRRKDKARKAYGYYSTEQKRQFVPIANVNKKDHLIDKTGNRRYIPLHIQKAIDAAGLHGVIQQLYAEAMVCMRAYVAANGTPDIRMSPEHWAYFGELQSNSRARSAVEDHATLAIDKIPYGTVRAVDLYRATGVDERRVRVDGPAIKAAMKDAGWTEERKRILGMRNAITVFTKGDVVQQDTMVILDEQSSTLIFMDRDDSRAKMTEIISLEDHQRRKMA
jgi:hypothetical protein